MVPPDDALVLRLAELAHLDVSGSRASELRADLAHILAMVEKLGELDLDNVDPLRYVSEVDEAQRPDTVGDHLPRETTLAQAPESVEGFFRVPRVIPQPEATD